MKKIVVCCGVFLLAWACNVGAVTMEELVKSRINGVTNPKKNKDGSIKSLLIIGRGALNKLLDATEAEEDAREDAAINATAAFSEYLNKSVTVSRARSTSTVAGTQGAEKNGQVNEIRSVEKLSVRSQEFKSLSKAAIAGMKEVHAEVYNGFYVIIYAWDKDECKQLKDVIITMSETAQTAVKEAKDLESRLHAPLGVPQRAVKSRSQGTQGRRTIKRNYEVKEGGSSSPDADKYL